MFMVRLNITLPDELAKKIANRRNKSQFIAQALKEKIEREERARLEKLLIEGYAATSKEDSEIQSDWEKDGLEGWE